MINFLLVLYLSHELVVEPVLLSRCYCCLLFFFSLSHSSDLSLSNLQENAFATEVVVEYVLQTNS